MRSVLERLKHPGEIFGGVGRDMAASTAKSRVSLELYGRRGLTAAMLVLSINFVWAPVTGFQFYKCGDAIRGFPAAISSGKCLITIFTGVMDVEKSSISTSLEFT